LRSAFVWRGDIAADSFDEVLNASFGQASGVDSERLLAKRDLADIFVVAEKNANDFAPEIGWNWLPFLSE
jgi:hypothetical protein